MIEWKTNYVIKIAIIIIIINSNNKAPQDLLANTRTRSFAVQSAFLPLKNASLCIEVSPGTGKITECDFRLLARCK